MNTRKKIILVAIPIIILAFTGIYYFTNTKNTDNKNQSENTTTKIPASVVKDKPIGEVDYDPPTSSEANPTLDPVVSESSEDKPQFSPIPINITYAGGSPLQVRVVINELIGSGSCILTLKRGEETVHTQTVEVFASASSSTCKGFTVDTAAIPAGKYTANVSVESGERKGSTTKELSL